MLASKSDTEKTRRNRPQQPGPQQYARDGRKKDGCTVVGLGQRGRDKSALQEDLNRLYYLRRKQAAALDGRKYGFAWYTRLA